MRAHAHPTSFSRPEFLEPVWLEAATKEELIRDIIWHEQASSWLASKVYKGFIRDERDLDEVHNEQVARHMGGDPSAVPFTLYYEDGTSEETFINLTAATIRHELGV